MLPQLTGFQGLRTISESHAGPSTSGGLAEPTVTQDELRLAQSHVSHKHTNNNAQSPTSKSNNSTVSVNKEFGDNVPSAGALTIISPVEKAEVSPVPGSSTIPCVTGKDQGANAVQRSIHRPSDSPSCRAGIAGQSSKLNSGSSTRSNIKEEDLLGNPRAIAGGLKQASKPVGLSKVKPVNENKSSTLAKTKQVGSPAQAEAEESARSTKLSESTGGDKTISSNLEPKNADIEHGPQHIDANVQPAKTAQAVVIANHCLFNVNGHVCPNQIQGLKLHLCNVGKGPSLQKLTLTVSRARSALTRRRETSANAADSTQDLVPMPVMGTRTKVFDDQILP